jgi:hypothetical protein
VYKSYSRFANRMRSGNSQGPNTLKKAGHWAKTDSSGIGRIYSKKYIEDATALSGEELEKKYPKLAKRRKRKKGKINWKDVPKTNKDCVRYWRNED